MGKVLKELYLHGNFKELSLLIDKEYKIESLDDDRLLFLGKVKDKLGQMSDLENMINELKTRKSIMDDDSKAVRFALLCARMHYHRGDYDEANEILGSVKKGSTLLNQRGFIGELFFELAKISLVQGRTPDAESNFYKSLNYFDIQNHATQIIAVYHWLAKNSIQLMQINSVNKYLTLVNELIELINSQYLKAWYENTKSEYFVLKGDLKSAEKHVNKATSIHLRLTASPLNLWHDYKVSGQIQLLNGNWDKAYDLFFKAENQQTMLCGDRNISESRLLRLFVESKFNYSDAIRQLKDVTKMSEMSQSRFGLSNFLLNAALVIFSKTFIEKEKGTGELQRLVVGTENILIKNAAQNLLKTGKVSGIF